MNLQQAIKIHILIFLSIYQSIWLWLSKIWYACGEVDIAQQISIRKAHDICHNVKVECTPHILVQPKLCKISHFCRGSFILLGWSTISFTLSTSHCMYKRYAQFPHIFYAVKFASRLQTLWQHIPLSCDAMRVERADKQPQQRCLYCWPYALGWLISLFFGIFGLLIHFSPP